MSSVPSAKQPMLGEQVLVEPSKFMYLYLPENPFPYKGFVHLKKVEKCCCVLLIIKKQKKLTVYRSAKRSFLKITQSTICEIF